MKRKDYETVCRVLAMAKGVVNEEARGRLGMMLMIALADRDSSLNMGLFKQQARLEEAVNHRQPAGDTGAAASAVL